MSDQTSFDDYSKRAAKALRQGAWGVASKYFNLAKDAAQQLAKQAMTPELRQRYEGFAAKMRAAAADCDTAKAEGRKPPESAEKDPPTGGAEAPARPTRTSRPPCARSKPPAEEAENRREYDAAATYYLEAAEAFHDLSLQPEQAPSQEILA